MTERLIHGTVITHSARRLEYPSVASAVIRNVELPPLSDDGVIIKCLYSGISRGTEGLVFHGQVPASEHDRMQCPHMAGEFPFPVAYGYCCVGEVVGIGENVNTIKPGQRIFVLHPHQNLFQVDQSMCNPLPGELSADRAVLAANMETALNALWDSEVESAPKNSPCAVIGAGVVGFLTAHALREVAGVQPVMLDVDPAKAEIAEQLNLDFALVEELTNAKEKRQFDFLFHTSASGAGLQTAIDLAKFEATIIEMSWYGAKSVELVLGGAFHSQRLKLVSSQVGSVAPQKRATHAFAQRMQEAMQLLFYEKLDCLLEPAIEFEELPNHLEEVFGPHGARLCQLVRY